MKPAPVPMNRELKSSQKSRAPRHCGRVGFCPRPLTAPAEASAASAASTAGDVPGCVRMSGSRTSAFRASGSGWEASWARRASWLGGALSAGPAGLDCRPPVCSRVSPCPMVFFKDVALLGAAAEMLWCDKQHLLICWWKGELGSSLAAQASIRGTQGSRTDSPVQLQG